MLGYIITAVLLVLCGAICAICLYAVVRGIFYRPAPKNLKLRVTQRFDYPSEWFTLALRRPLLWCWLPLPRFQAGHSIAINSTVSTTKRRYSLARWSALPFSYQVTIKREVLGKVSNALWRDAQPNTMLNVSLPSGEFVIQANPNQPLVFIAGGVGITPLLAMLDEQLGKVRAPIHLFWQVRAEHEWVYKTELEQLVKRHSHLHTYLLASRPEAVGSKAERISSELIQQKLGKLTLTAAHFYLCASQYLLDSLIDGLSVAGVPSTQIHFERFSVATQGTTGQWALNIQGQNIPFDQHKTLLDALEDGAINIASDCRTGTCGQCQIRVTQGTTRQVITPEFIPTEGCVLACCCVPESDLVIT